MMHSVPITFSPSSFRITRSTPCVDGCCGPILRTSSVESRNVASGMDGLLAAFDIQIFPHPAIVLLNQAVLLTQRESLPLLGQQDTPHVGVPGELDTEHVEDLAFEPIGCGVHGGGGCGLHAVADGGLEPDPLIAGEAVEDIEQVEAVGALRIIDG